MTLLTHRTNAPTSFYGEELIKLYSYGDGKFVWIWVTLSYLH